MLSGEKVLVTGPAGRIAEPLCRYLSDDNEVWGIARFSDGSSRERIESLGVTTRVCDLGRADFGDLPTDFTIVLHLAASLGQDTDYDAGFRTNAEGTGLLLQHCQTARAALVMSTCSVYKPHPDPWHPFREDDPVGENALPAQPTYAITKIAEEAVARYAARAFRLPTVIARMNSAYGPKGGLPDMQLEQMLAGQPVIVRYDPSPYSPIAQDDINAQLEALIGAASVPATIVNWGGDEAVGPHDWCPYLADLAGIEATLQVVEAPGAQRGVVVDVARRQSFTGKCSVSWKDGMRAMFEARHPDLA